MTTVRPAGRASNSRAKEFARRRSIEPRRLGAFEDDATLGGFAPHIERERNAFGDACAAIAEHQFPLGQIDAHTARFSAARAGMRLRARSSSSRTLGAITNRAATALGEKLLYQRRLTEARRRNDRHQPRHPSLRKPFKKPHHAEASRPPPYFL